MCSDILCSGMSSGIGSDMLSLTMESFLCSDIGSGMCSDVSTGESSDAWSDTMNEI